MTIAPRILVVAKNAITSSVLPMLQRMGCQVVGRYESGIDGINKTVTLDPDLILMDTGPAGAVDGIDAARYIYQIFQYPVILLSDNPDTRFLSRARIAQPYGVFCAPFNEAEIVCNIELALYNHSMKKKCLGPYPVGNPKNIAGNLEVVIIMDTKGRIFFCNPYASWFIGLADKEVMMSYWRNVLMLINDQTGEPIKDPLPEVLTQCTAINYDTNTAVVTKAGKRRKVSISIRPIRDDRDVLMGAVMKMKEKPVI
jgi:two-component system, response regulator PdtaR